VIALVSAPTVRRSLRMPDGRAAVLLEHGPMTLYAFGLEVHYAAEVEVVVSSPAHRGRPPAAAQAGRARPDPGRARLRRLGARLRRRPLPGSPESA
jgi:hypothetical protein